MVEKRESSKREFDHSKFLKQFSSRLLNIRKGFEPKRISRNIAGVYLLLGILWILFSDVIADALITDIHIATIISMVKGWVYVGVTAAVIYSLVNSVLGGIKAAEQEIIKGYEELDISYARLETAHKQLISKEEELRTQYNMLLESQKKLEGSEERYRLISEATNDAIWDQEGEKITFSDRWFEITGYSREELDIIGGWHKLIHPEDIENSYNKIMDYLKGKMPYYCCEYRIKVKDGRYKWIQARGKAVINEDGTIHRLAGSHTDITQLKEYQENLRYNAYHDKLTGFSNRLALYEELSEDFSKNHGKKRALLYVDIDNFKYINDSLGHGFGDKLIVKVCERLRAKLNTGWSLYRLSGDEFVAYLQSYENFEEIEEALFRVFNSFKAPINVAGNIIHVSISAGLSLYPEHGNSPDELLKSADIALYRAKVLGKNKYVVYDRTMDLIFIKRMEIEKNLHTALENNEFEVYYQPQIDTEQGMVTGFEALLRWNSSSMGEVSPLEFIRVAEDTNLIIPIGEWVIRNACYFIKNLHNIGHKGLTISINISMLQLMQVDFAEMVTGVLDFLQLEPNCLELEITESVLMQSYEAIQDNLFKLRGQGVKIALDDFGKGYSSLNYLKLLPISTLKIDKTFIDSIITDDRDRTIIGHIVSMGRNMGLCVTAEGVETREQLEFLRERKCTKIQGFLFSKPLPEKEVISKLIILNGE